MDAAAYFIDYPYMAREAGGMPDGNAILYTGTYALIQKKLGIAANLDVLAKDVYDHVQVKPGVIHRANKPQDAETHDDYIGMLTISALANGKEAEEIYEYGKAHGWSYVNVAYNFADVFNGQFWRLPGVVQHIKLCAGKAWNWFDCLMFFIAVMANAFTAKNDTSGKILTWHYVSMYELKGDKSPLCEFAATFWKKRILEMYPNAMGDVFSIYFGPEHIFSKYTIGVI